MGAMYDLDVHYSDHNRLCHVSVLLVYAAMILGSNCCQLQFCLMVLPL